MLDEDGSEGEIAMHNVVLVQIAAEDNEDLICISSHTMCSSPSLIPSPHSTAIVAVTFILQAIITVVEELGMRL